MATPKWPHDHAAKHARAARKGWAKRRAPGSTVAKFGGSSLHTEKMHYLKPRKKAASKKPVTKAAPKPAEDTFQYVATQKANGKWIVSKVYKSGKIVNSPKEYDKNPIPGKPVKKQAFVEGQGSLFGGTYTKGLFG